jgi:hypothetical protein
LANWTGVPGAYVPAGELAVRVISKIRPLRPVVAMSRLMPASIRVGENVSPLIPTRPGIWKAFSVPGGNDGRSPMNPAVKEYE